MTDTICALATSPGRAAVAVVRLSGPGTWDALQAIGAKALKPRRASLRSLVDADGARLDQSLCLWFPAPGSYTGEDCAELHLHGGSAVVETTLTALLQTGLRLAEPGEFTRRAFENGKLDLDQAEAVADLVDAESMAQARQAIAQLDGALGRRYQAWRNRLVEILAQLEAAVDFPDEEVPAEVEARARDPLEALIAELSEALIDGERGRRVRDGYTVAVIGAPNAGKSSLFNRLVGRDAAIVTAAAGTTRDIIEAPLVLAGYRLTLADMAGLRDTAEEVEREGVRRARAWAAGADLRLWVVDQAESAGSWRLAADLARPGDLCLLNKSDLPRAGDGAEAAVAAREGGLEVESLSLAKGGAEDVRAWLTRRVVRDLAGRDFPAVTRARHARHLERARDSLRAALGALREPELAAEDVRLAARALAMVSGAIGVEDVLGEIFASFCIGK
jgi:tRNA modification GTPase